MHWLTHFLLSGLWLLSSLSAAMPRAAWIQQQKLLASDGQASDRFADAVALEGTTAVLGSPRSSGGGSAYVFIDNGSAWVEQQKLMPSDGASGDLFGSSVAVSGDTAIIGAPNHATERGAAYVFVRSSGVWTFQQKLTASDGLDGDWLGYAVALSGDTALVGAPNHDASGMDSGAAYVFVRSGGVWTQQQKLLVSNGAAGDWLGGAVALRGDTALVSAYQDTHGGIQSGSAYIFVRSGGVWTQQQKLFPTDGNTGERFGIATALSADTALIGASHDNDNGAHSGSAYVFVRSGSVWSFQQKLLPTDGTGNTIFGQAVALDGDMALVGVPHANVVATHSGAAYLFTRTGSVWTQRQKLLPADGGEGDTFGSSVAVSVDTLLVGADDDSDNGANSGSAYIFGMGARPPTPLPLSPAHRSHTPDHTPSFTWTNTGADMYRVRVYTENLSYDVKERVVGNTTLTWQENLAVGKYLWRVRGRDGSSQVWSDYSQRFTLFVD